MIIECAFGNDAFELPIEHCVARVRSNSVLWQKERLLNVVLRRLPSNCRNVASMDTDILFEDTSWLLAASEALKRYPVIQLFESVIRLPKGHVDFRGQGDCFRSFASKYKASPGCEKLGWYKHGHTGFAWAAQRRLLDACGFFDLCLSGVGDHVMSHGFVGDWYSKCVDNLVGLGSPLHSAFRSWARVAYQATEGKLGSIPGRILHLWHGDAKNRRYLQRAHELRRFEFSPSRDLLIDESGCWSWANGNVKLQDWAARSFADRREDGEP
jgi:hypothetical protein